MPPNIARATNGDTAAILRRAEARGWVIGLTRRSQIRCLGPGGAIVIAALTPGHRSSLRHLDADLRRAERRAAGGAADMLRRAREAGVPVVGERPC